MVKSLADGARMAKDSTHAQLMDGHVEHLCLGV